jgi:hypothetical protein
MGHRQARPHHELDNEIAVADAVHAVLSHGVKPELLTEEFTIDRKRIASKGATTEGEHGDTRYQLLKAL